MSSNVPYLQEWQILIIDDTVHWENKNYVKFYQFCPLLIHRYKQKPNLKYHCHFIEGYAMDQWEGRIFGFVSFVPRYNFWHNGIWMGWIQEWMRQGSSETPRLSRKVLPRGRTKNGAKAALPGSSVIVCNSAPSIPQFPPQKWHFKKKGLFISLLSHYQSLVIIEGVCLSWRYHMMESDNHVTLRPLVIINRQPGPLYQK